MKTTVIVCAYTMDRWSDLCRALDSLTQQSVLPDQIIVVIDYNDELFEKSRETFFAAEVLANDQTQGLSGARNAGVIAAVGDVVLFLDDDAYAEKDWIAQNLAAFVDENVAGVGSWIEPDWAGPAPAYFPETFLWVMGCSYSGLPADGERIRNPIGAGMAVRRNVFTQVGGFTSGLGRVGVTPLGCEETELCIRYTQHHPDSRFVHAPNAIVHHRVPDSRLSWSYFLRRCWAEGLSKAVVASLVGADAGLSAERRHAATAMPKEILSSLRSMRTNPRASLERVVRIAVGGVVAVAGVIRGTWSVKRGTTGASVDENETPASSWRPMAMISCDVEAPSSDITVEDPEATKAWVEGLLQGQLVTRAVLDVHDGRVLAADLEEFVHQSDWVRPSVERPVSDQELPRMTVIVPTIAQDVDLLHAMAEGLAQLDYPSYDVIIVDNRPEGDVAALPSLPLLASGRSIRVVRETTPGVSAARNRGVLETTNEFLAFTDDDVLVEKNWLRKFGERFARNPEVAAIGGLVAPKEISHPCQLWFEEYFGGFSKNFALEITSPEVGREDPLFPYAPGRFAAGCNMAFRREALLRLGGFALALGAGTPSMGGEDLDIFLRLALHEETLCFEPAALVRHRHRTTEQAFRRQVLGYGAGLSAMYTKLILSDPRHLLQIARRAPLGVQRLTKNRAKLSPTSAPSYPKEMKNVERRGVLMGPWLYVKSARKYSKLGAHAVNVPDPLV